MRSLRGNTVRFRQAVLRQRRVQAEAPARPEPATGEARYGIPDPEDRYGLVVRPEAFAPLAEGSD